MVSPSMNGRNAYGSALKELRKYFLYSGMILYNKEAFY